MYKVNRCGRFDLCMIAVSLLAKGVDWNINSVGVNVTSKASPFLRREWIETSPCWLLVLLVYRLPSCEGSGLKLIKKILNLHLIRLPSCEGSGLKLIYMTSLSYISMSPFLRREWIETLPSIPSIFRFTVSLLAKGVDWNNTSGVSWVSVGWSPFLRREWIETLLYQIWQWIKRVSLLAKGVDWNIFETEADNDQVKSPFLRREWIETCLMPVRATVPLVSLLAKGVDWNSLTICAIGLRLLSPFLRREWIETILCRHESLWIWSPFLRREWIETHFGCLHV